MSHGGALCVQGGRELWLAGLLNPSDSQSQEKIYPLPLRQNCTPFGH